MENIKTKGKRARLGLAKSTDILFRKLPLTILMPVSIADFQKI